jgi:thiamine biosynthesis protein ThiI
MGQIVIRPASELGTKSRQTRRHFQNALRRNIGFALKRAGASCKLVQDFGRVYLETDAPEAAARVLPRVFGIGNFSIIEAECAPNVDAIVAAATAAFGARVGGSRFAVRAKRVRAVGLSTQQINYRVGDALRAHGGIVDLDHPGVTIAIEVSEERAQLFADRVPGAQGLPIGVGGHVVALLSGGFDSSVAAWRMLRRGVRVDYVFCNLGGGAYERMVLHVAKALHDTWGHGHLARLHVTEFAEPLKAVRAAAPKQFWQVVLKRQMYRAASAVAEAAGANAIVTSESLGQVSSQTLANLCAIEAAATKPVLRPLLGFDKQEVIDEAERIGTAALSRRIKEYCDIVPSNPVTATMRERIDAAEASLDTGVLAAAVAARRDIVLHRVRPQDLRPPTSSPSASPTARR